VGSRNSLAASSDSGLVLTCDVTNKRCETTLGAAITSGIYYFGTWRSGIIIIIIIIINKYYIWFDS